MLITYIATNTNEFKLPSYVHEENDKSATSWLLYLHSPKMFCAIVCVGTILGRVAFLQHLCTLLHIYIIFLLFENKIDSVYLLYIYILIILCSFNCERCESM